MNNDAEEILRKLEHWQISGDVMRKLRTQMDVAVTLKQTVLQHVFETNSKIDVPPQTKTLSKTTVSNSFCKNRHFLILS